VADPASQRVRTYHARRGRLSDGHRAALADVGERWLLDATGGELDLALVFGRPAPVVLDIGCGMGESSLAQAVAAPDVSILAIDVHTRGIATLLRHGEEAGLTNVRVVLGDAVTLIEQRVRRRSLAGARIYFPDPWPKARHHKRRLVQPDFVALLVDRLAPGGFIHCATDDEGYAAQMLEVVDAEPLLENPFAGFAPRHLTSSAAVGAVDRPVTKYERRARRLGHPVRDVLATRRLPA
jgi:tRNA (guanine-N7-)-methyltransferase